MYIRATKILRGNDLARCCLDQWRTAEENRPLFANDNRLVRHGRHIGATCRARAHDDSYLRNALRGHIGLIVENPTEMMRLPEIRRFCTKHGFVLTSIADIVQYRRETEKK